MHDFLTAIGFSPLVADFIANPEWLHIGSASLLILMMIGVAYLIRVDIDPFILGTPRSFNANIERLFFWPAVAGILLWGYYAKWEGENLPPGIEYICALIAVLVLVLGRAIIHFVHTEKNRWDFFDQLPFYLMVEFQFMVPLIYYFQLERNGLMPKEQLGFAFTCVFICYFLVRYLIGRPTHIPRNRVPLFLGLFIAYMLLTVVIFHYRLAAVKNVIQWIAFASCFLIGLAYIQDKRRRDAVLLTAVIAATVCTLWGFWKYFDIPLHLFGLSNGVYEEGHLLAGQEFFYKTPSAGRYFLLAGFFANPNYYGEYLALTLFIGLGLFLATDSHRLRTFLAIALAINTFEMASLYNRAGWLGIFIGGGFVLFGLMWARLQIFKRITKTGLATGIAVLIVVMVLVGTIFNAREKDQTPLSDTPWERLKSMTDFSGDETFRNRLTMWRTAGVMVTDKEAFPQRLIFGGGFGFFEVQYLPHQTKVLETYEFEDWFHNVIPTFRAHNDHIQMLVEAGIVGTAFYALFFIFFFLYGFRFLKEEKDPKRRFWALGILGATASLLATAFFSFPLHKIQHGGLIFVAMGFLIAEIVSHNQAIANVIIIDQAKADGKIPGAKKKKRKKEAKKAIATKTSVLKAQKYNPAFYIPVRKKFRLEARLVLTTFIVLLTVWGVYTQVVNFKSHYLVVKGIAAIRNIQGNQTHEQRQAIGQMAADFFDLAYKLDPTNGRAEFFHGFALIKKDVYEDVVEGTERLEEGQILYPQSDTFFALGMGYEARNRLARQYANIGRQGITGFEESLAHATTEEERNSIQQTIDDTLIKIEEFEADAEYSRQKAIDSYMTAAYYYPVKIEYYKDLVRLLIQEGDRHEDIILWCERALLVDAWLLKKPMLRWQFCLWLGQTHRTVSLAAIENGDTSSAIASLNSALDALNEGLKLSNGVYYTYHELGLVYENLGDIYAQQEQISLANENYMEARDNYVELYRFKKRHLKTGPDFNTARANVLLGRIYLKLGEDEIALEKFQNALTSPLEQNTEIYKEEARKYIHDLTDVWEEAVAGEAEEDVPEEELVGTEVEDIKTTEETWEEAGPGR